MTHDGGDEAVARAGGADALPPRRWTAQLLSGPPAESPRAVARRLLAVQAQDPRGARLAVRSRTRGVSAADVDTALADGSLVVSWLNRGTLHLVAAEDYWWLHPLTTPPLATANARRLRAEGVSATQAEAGVGVVATATASEGPQTRAALRTRLDEAGVPTEGQALVHVLMAATLAGHVVRAVHDGAEVFVDVRAWLGPPPPPLDEDEALARLACRYLAGHGPADAADLARWAGVTLGRARHGLDAAGDVLHRRDDGLVDLAARADGGDALDDARAAAGPPPPRLLGPFDPLLLGWVSRDAIVGPHGSVGTTTGVVRPVALVDGRVVAWWGLADGTVTLRPLEPVADDVLAALRADAREVLGFLGLPHREAVVEESGASRSG